MKTLKIIFAISLFALLITGCEQEDLQLMELEELTIDNRSSFPELIQLPEFWRPEGITMGTGHDAFVGCFYNGAIWKLDLSTGEGNVLVEPGSNKTALGLAFDARSNYLFACGGAYGNLYVYDGDSGDEIAVYQLALSPPTWVNDVVVTRKAVYITDSQQPYLYKLPLGPAGALPPATAVEQIPLSGDYVHSTVPGLFGLPLNANGIDATPNGKDLILVHTDFGQVFHVNPKTGYATLVDLGGNSLFLPDGIILEPQSTGDYMFYAVSGAMNTIMEVELNADLMSGNISGMITDPDFQFPTTADAFGNHLYGVNARFDNMDPFLANFHVVRVDK
jgi:sugar lactone lactonase YvrE